MKAGSIAVIIVCLILPVGAYGLTETRPNSQSAQVDSNGLRTGFKIFGCGF